MPAPAPASDHPERSAAVYVLLGLKVLASGSLLWAALTKLRSQGAMGEFIDAMRQLLGWRTERRPLLLAAGVTVASIELVISLLILVPATATAGLVAALGLLTGFTVLIAKTVAGGRQVRCHCFGSSGGALRPDHLWRNSALLLAIVA